MSRRAKLSLSDTERRKGPPPAHGFDTADPSTTASDSSGVATAGNEDAGHRAGGSPRAAATAEPEQSSSREEPRPAGGAWKVDLGTRQATSDTASDASASGFATAAGEEPLPARPFWQQPAVRVALVSAAAILSLWLLKRRLL
jgi:hypothetical protein